jgi:hypothetical protein
MTRAVAHALLPAWLARRVAAVTRDRVSLKLLRVKFRLVTAIKAVV